VFCEVTGLNGKTGRIGIEEALSGQVDEAREVTVEFVAAVNSDLPWEIKPMVRRVTVHPGAVTEVKYWARNTTGETVIGQAVPSLVHAAAIHCRSGASGGRQLGRTVVHLFQDGRRQGQAAGGRAGTHITVTGCSRCR
jgi:hypothetical protein